MNTSTSNLLLGTSKGLIVYQKNGEKWSFSNDHFLGQSVSIAIADPRSGRWWVSLSHKHWGQKVHISDNQGKTWTEVPCPKYADDAEISNNKKAVLRYIWTIQPGRPDRPEEIYIGTEPGGLFRSENEGADWELINGLWEHPSRPQHWFGGGRTNAGIHSVVIDPRDSNHIYVGISCAGVFESLDNGDSWNPINSGLRADYLPDKYPEVGHDPHRLLICESSPDVLWQQNHCGVFNTKNGGKEWIEVSDKTQSVYYGFPIVIDPSNPERAWVIPAVSDQLRVAVDRSLFVASTNDGGKTWRKVTEGLPQGNFYDIVLRHSFDRNDDFLAFGTNSGSLFVSSNDGVSWEWIANALPRIYSLYFA